MNLHDAVYKRISTRTFQKKQLNKDDITKIKRILAAHIKKCGPFGNSFEYTFNINNSKDTNGKKIGTYGLLKNVPAFFGGVCQNTTVAVVDFGYVFEHIILNLTMEGFGTCWLGGTFKREQYRKDLLESEIIPAISPIGYPASKRSLIDKVLRSGAQSDNRLPFNTLFLDVTLNHLDPDKLGNITDCLNMVRKAPSASNKQPWRAIVDFKNGLYHFYIARTNNYAKLLKYDIQALDIGIALAHFEIGLTHFDITFNREILEDHPSKEGWEYIISLKTIHH